MNDKPEGSRADGITRRAFWSAAAGGACGWACRMDGLAKAQGILILASMALLLVGGAFGVIALIRSWRGADGTRNLLALATVLLALTLLVNLEVWARGHAIKARMAARTAQPTTTPERAARPTEPVVASFSFEFPPFDRIPAVVAQVKDHASAMSGNDAAALQTWAAQLQEFHARYMNTLAASNELHAVDFLDPATVTVLDDKEGVRRRQLANRYSAAWHEVEETVWSMKNSFPGLSTQLETVQNICQAEQKVGLQYNYGASAVFDFVRLTKSAPALEASQRKRMDEQVSKAREAIAVAAELRRQVFGEMKGQAAKEGSRRG